MAKAKSSHSRKALLREPSATTRFRVENHLLLLPDGKPVPFQQTPNHGGEMKPEFLIMHFTAGRDLETSARWFMNPDAKASAHLLIGRKGEVLQMAPFNMVAWHAGKSSWAGREGFNNFSIGIELDNAGKLESTEGGWKAWFGVTIPGEQVLRATHKDESAPAGWHLYTEAQLSVAVEVATAIVRHYSLREVLGHDDIAPIRKKDPGPAFPSASFRAKVMGREDEAEEIYETTTNVNIRLRPESSAPKVLENGLPAKTQVSPLGERQAAWWKVKVLDAVAGDADIEGWVHGSFLKLKKAPTRGRP